MKKQSNIAFTYIEMMITIVIIAICFVPLTRMFASSISEVAYAGDKLTALNLAREEIEKVKNLNLTENQLLAMGDLITPSPDKLPLERNRAYWRIKRKFKEGSDPLELRVEVFREDKDQQKIIELAILIEDLEWLKED